MKCKEDKGILTMTNSIGLMTYMALYDKFEFTETKIRNFYEAVMALKLEWNQDKVTSQAMLNYCKLKKIDIEGCMGRIPKSKKLMLAGKKNMTPKLLPYIDSGFRINIMMSAIVLKEKYRFSIAKVNEYLKWIEYYVDSYTRKQPKTNIYYLNDEMILSIFREEMHLDLNTGRKV